MGQAAVNVTYEEVRNGMFFVLPGVAHSPEDQNDLANIVHELRLHNISVHTNFSRIYSDDGRSTLVLTSAQIERADVNRAKAYCHLM